MYFFCFQVVGAMVAPHRAGRAGQSVTQMGSPAITVVAWQGRGQAVGLSHAQGWGQARQGQLGPPWSQGRAGMMVEGHGQDKKPCRDQAWWQ